ncbi:MAG: DUF2782 domain-containing protein [Pseudomonadota bacterium]
MSDCYNFNRRVFTGAAPILTVLALCFASPANGQSSQQFREAQPPPLPDRVVSGEALPPPPEPASNTTRSAAGVEYRSSGEVVGVEVRPANSTNRYLLMDTDGNGELDTRRNALEPGVSTNSKRLFSWD